MIGVSGQYVFMFSIKQGNTIVRSDFIQEGELRTCTIIEEAGNTLPQFELMFDTQDKDVLPFLNEGNDIDIAFGRSNINEELVTSKFTILRSNYNRIGESKYSVYINGLYSAIKYLCEDKIAQYANLSGVEAIKQVVEEHLTFESNITQSRDSQTWLRPNTSAKRFVNDTWMHSYLPNSFIGIGIDSTGKFILKDMKLNANTFAEKSNFSFTTDVKGENDILYDGDYVPESNTGFLNYWQGYGRERHTFGMETGIDVDVSTSPTGFLTNSDSFVRTSDIIKKSAEARFSNDNIHSKYWEAYQQNLQNLVLFSTHKNSVSFHREYKDIHVLDVVDFSDVELNDQSRAGMSAGKYFVSKVSRNVSHKNFVTTVQLCRESVTDVQGKLR